MPEDRRRRVLLVEDTEVNQALAVAILAKLGYSAPAAIQRDRRMPQVMNAQPLQASRTGRRAPHPGAEVGGPQRVTVRQCEHEACPAPSTG
jgi:hypothetical protein